jgi:rhodanese-related sulfurtransferase
MLNILWDKRQYLWGLALISALGLASCQKISGESLDAVVETVSRLHPVAGIDASGLSDSATVSEKRVVVFDVREVDEFNVSHLDGAIRVDPDVEADAFLKQHGELLKDRTAVFYCSVGYRSSILVERLAEATGDSVQLVNLRGGIFKWFNQGLAVYDSSGVTDAVHPFSDVWGRFLLRRAGEEGRN